jgi:hypothetical protein
MAAAKAKAFVPNIRARDSPSAAVVLEQQAALPYTLGPYVFPPPADLLRAIELGPAAVPVDIGKLDDRNYKHATCALGAMPTTGIYLCSLCNEVVSSYYCAVCSKSICGHYADAANAKAGAAADAAHPPHMFKASRVFNSNARNHTCCRASCVSSSFQMVQLADTLAPCLEALTAGAERICAATATTAPVQSVAVLLGQPDFLELPDEDELTKFADTGDATGVPTIHKFTRGLAALLRLLPPIVKQMQAPPLKRAKHDADAAAAKEENHPSKRDRRHRRTKEVGERSRAAALADALLRLVQAFVSGTSKSQFIASRVWIIKQVYPAIAAAGVARVLSKVFDRYIERFVAEQGELKLVGRVSFEGLGAGARTIGSLMAVILPATQKIHRSLRAANWRLCSAPTEDFVLPAPAVAAVPVRPDPITTTLDNALAPLSPSAIARAAATAAASAGGGAHAQQRMALWSLSDTPMSCSSATSRGLSAQSSAFYSAMGDDNNDGLSVGTTGLSVGTNASVEMGARLLQSIGPRRTERAPPSSSRPPSAASTPFSMAPVMSARPSPAMSAMSIRESSYPSLNMLTRTPFNTPLLFQTPMGDGDNDGDGDGDGDVVVANGCLCHLQKPNERCYFCMGVTNSEAFKTACNENMLQMIFPVCRAGSSDPICFLPNCVATRDAMMEAETIGPAPDRTTRAARRATEMAARHLDMLACRLTHHNTVRRDMERLFRIFLAESKRSL